MTDAWATLADDYATNRTGYSAEIYDAIAAFGLHRGARVLDIGCGTGIASAPFSANGFAVTGVDASQAMLARAKERFPQGEFVEGSAEALPFPDERFDIAIAAQCFHWFDRDRALAEAARVVRPGGIVAIWWKHLMDRDPVKLLREEVAREFGAAQPPNGLTGGFREFYGSDVLGEQALRVLPWRTAMPLDRYIGYERSRRRLRQLLGPNAEQYYARLEQRLRSSFGSDGAPLPLSYIHYLYLAKKR